MPEITVCLPVYNGEKYLANCLDSILAQTFNDFEVVVIDDKSSDGSRKIVESYAILDNRIKLYANETNQGLVGNWNKCVELAECGWIKFVFQDDVLDPGCLEKLIGSASAGDLIIACERTYLFEGVAPEVEAEYGEYLERLNLNAIFGGKCRLTPDDIASAAMAHPCLNFIGEPTSVLLHKDVFKEFGTFNPDFVHLCDLEFWIRVASNTGLVYVPESLVTFRVHSTSTSATNRDRRYYRSEVLDPLLLLHEYAYNPLFAQVRKMAALAEPPLNLRKMIGQKAHWAYVTARQIAKKDSGANGALLEWRQVLAKFPRIRTLQFRWLMMKDFFARHLLWRLSRRLSAGGPVS